MSHDTLDSGFFFEDELAGSGLSAVQSAVSLAEEDEPLVPTENVVFEKPRADVPAAERIADLLGKMGTFRTDLLEIIRYCEGMRSVDETNAHINALKENNHSVYSPATLCSLLERAGALVRVNAQGEPAGAVVAEPVVVTDEQGNEYLQAAEQQPSFWLATEDGLAAVETNQPAGRLQELLAASGAYLPIYQRVLQLCAASEDGAPLASLSAAVDHDPLVQSPRRAVTFFIDKLKECEALAWNGAWVTTEVGRAALSSLGADSPEDSKDSE